MKSHRSLIVFFISFIGVLGLSVGALYLVLVLLDINISADTLGSVGSLLQGTLGIAIGFSGAFVAVLISALSYELVTQQKGREDHVFITDKLEKAIFPIIRVAKELRGLYIILLESQSIKDQIVRRYQLKDTVNEDEFGRLTQEEAQYKTRLSKALDNLVDALEEVNSNSYALYMWQESGKGKSFCLDKHGLNNSIYEYSVYKDLPEVASVLRMFARFINHPSNHTVDKAVAPRGMARLSKTSQGAPFNNHSVRIFLELGAEIWTLTGNDAEGKGYVANLGAAILYEITLCIPQTSGELRIILNDLFSDMVDAKLLDRNPLLIAISRLGVESWYGVSLSAAIAHFRDIEPTLIHSQFKSS